MIRTAVLINHLPDGAREARLAGLPLRVRTVLAAQQAGIDQLVVIGGDDPAAWLPSRARLRVQWVPVQPASEIEALCAARPHLNEAFLIVFVDSVVDTAALAGLRAVALNGRLLLRVPPQAAGEGAAASVFLASPELFARLASVEGAVTLEALWAAWFSADAGSAAPAEDRIWERTTRREKLAEVEEEFLRRHLKPTDGRFARFNKIVVGRPWIRFFLRTPATPNFITGLGLVLGLLSGVAFAGGSYRWSLLGALLAYGSAIMDHVDGMVARLKFLQSDFGTWFETAVDYASYTALFVGLAVGLYRETGFTHYLFVGALFLFAAVTSFLLQSHQRKRLSGDRPADYATRFQAKMEEHSHNFFHRFARQCYFLVRRAVLPYFVLLFCLLDLRTFLLGISTFGANLVWLLSLYFLNYRTLASRAEKPSILSGYR